MTERKMDQTFEKRKKVIAVPRLHEYNEHVNNHQKEIIEKFNKNKNIIGIQSVKELEGAIKRIKNFEPKPYEENNQKLLKIIEDFIDNIKSQQKEEKIEKRKSSRKYRKKHVRGEETRWEY